MKILPMLCLFVLMLTGLAAQTTFQSTCGPISPEIEARMCYSWKPNNPVPMKDLRYLTVTIWGFDGEAHLGELVVHQAVTSDLIEIFAELYEAHFPIQKMVLIDEYKAIDDDSMADNNSSAFCSRPITGTIDRFSKHSYGIAIDINPRQNPYVKGDTVLPTNGRAYLDRNQNESGMITPDSICYQSFIKRGWEWGGNWTSLKDYQHFEKNIF